MEGKKNAWNLLGDFEHIFVADKQIVALTLLRESSDDSSPPPLRSSGSS